MENKRDLSQDGAQEEMLASKDALTLRLSARPGYRFNIGDFAEVYEFVKDLATSRLNIGSAGVISGNYSHKSGDIYVQFGSMASFKDVVDISRTISSTGDLGCTSEVCAAKFKQAPAEWDRDRTLDTFE